MLQYVLKRRRTENVEMLLHSPLLALIVELISGKLHVF